MLQIIQAVIKDKGDKSKVSLLFANQVPADILLTDVSLFALGYNTLYQKGFLANR